MLIRILKTIKTKTKGIMIPGQYSDEKEPFDPAIYQEIESEREGVVEVLTERKKKETTLLLEEEDETTDIPPPEKPRSRSTRRSKKKKE